MKILTKIGKIQPVFGLGMTPIFGVKNGQIKSLNTHEIAYEGDFVHHLSTYPDLCVVAGEKK